MIILCSDLQPTDFLNLNDIQELNQDLLNTNNIKNLIDQVEKHNKIFKFEMYIFLRNIHPMC
jgi:hypothetical protein